MDGFGAATHHSHQRRIAEIRTQPQMDAVKQESSLDPTAVAAEGEAAPTSGAIHSLILFTDGALLCFELHNRCFNSRSP